MLNRLQVLSETEDLLKHMYIERDGGNRHFLDFDQLKPLCHGNGPLALDNLSKDMLKALASGHGLYFSPKIGFKWLLRWRLQRRAAVIKEQDSMIKNELLIGYMTQRELDWACYRRGLNPKDKLRLEQESFLREWLRIGLYYVYGIQYTKSVRKNLSQTYDIRNPRSDEVRKWMSIENQVSSY